LLADSGPELVIGIFGTASSLARNQWLLLSSAIVPLAMAVLLRCVCISPYVAQAKDSGYAYRYPGAASQPGKYLVASQIFPQRLIIPRTSEVRQAPRLKSVPVFSRPQTNLLLHRLERINHKANVFVQLNSQFSDT